MFNYHSNAILVSQGQSSATAHIYSSLHMSAICKIAKLPLSDTQWGFRLTVFVQPKKKEIEKQTWWSDYQSHSLNFMNPSKLPWFPFINFT